MTVAPPEIDPFERDPVTAYGRARERSPLARMPVPGMGSMWVLTQYEGARAMLADPRFAPGSGSYPGLDVPADCRPYLRTMQEMDGPEHARLRRLVAPAFTPRRAATFRPRIEALTEALLAPLAGDVDLVPRFARPLPIDVICELVGIPTSDRERWREYGATVAAGAGERFAAAIPDIMAGAKEAVARRRAAPGDDLVSDLIQVQAEDGDRLGDTELVTLVWHLVLAGQVPAGLIANAVDALLDHPAQLAALRDDPRLIPGAVEELMRWCGPQLLTIPRFAREDVELHGTVIRAGEPVTAALAAANRDPRVFDDPDRLDITRDASGHLAFAHGPHFCLGAAPARVQAEVALGALLRRFPDLTRAADPRRAVDPGTWRTKSLPVRLGP